MFSTFVAFLGMRPFICIFLCAFLGRFFVGWGGGGGGCCMGIAVRGWGQVSVSGGVNLLFKYAIFSTLQLAGKLTNITRGKVGGAQQVSERETMRIRRGRRRL